MSVDATRVITHECDSSVCSIGLPVEIMHECAIAFWKSLVKSKNTKIHACKKQNKGTEAYKMYFDQNKVYFITLLDLKGMNCSRGSHTDRLVPLSLTEIDYTKI